MAGKEIKGLACSLFLGVVTMLLLQFPATAGSADYNVSEYEVKAAFLFNFTKFVEWPREAFYAPGEPLTICIVGDDPFGAGLDFIRNKSVNNRGLEIRRLGQPADTRDCHVLFIAYSEKTRMREILNSVVKQEVLTVSDISGFAGSGGVIEMYIKDRKVRFRVNTSAARRHHLKIGSQLLELAEIVTDKEQ